MNYSYSRIHFGQLPQAVAKNLINILSQKVHYDSMMINQVIKRFSPNEVKSHFHICDHSIITFCRRLLCLGFSNTSWVDILYRFIKSVVDKVKTDVCTLKKTIKKKII